ncbi:TerD family protein [Frankia sp. Cppng1_Ct_nod]|uniref:TerD family protein n=1 Tax=Frankia sp. Cppng1_Ct_nod TaxID=2897162 RepID=UPI00104197B9|nr:TerD family protein [Frankia sp. Cppng1_Ct_nod]
MGIDVAKGAEVSLRTGGSGLTHITVGLGWDPDLTGSTEFDLDASAIALTADGRAPSRDFFVYFNNLSTPHGEIVHRGDNLTGEADGAVGDDEQIDIRLDRLSRSITRIVFPVSIYHADDRQQSFGDVRNAYIRVLDADSGTQLARYDLTTQAATETAMLFGEVTRDNAGWAFRALGQGRATGLTGIAREYGLDV